MQKLLIWFKAAIRKLPGCLGTVQHNSGSQHIGLYKNLRMFNTAVYMTLCCEVDYSVNIVLSKHPADGFLITDICFHKGIIVSFLNILQILQIARVGQGIHIDDPDLLVIFLKHIMNII